MLDIVTAQMSKQYAEKPDEPELAKELCRRFYRLGYVCEKVQKRDKAINAYEKAYQLDSTYLAVLEGYGHLLVEVKRWEEAQRVYQSILVHHRGDLTDLEVAEIYWTLGDLHLQQKQLDKAENHFEKALAIDPQHEASLRSMVALCEQNQAWDKAADYRQKLMQVATGDERFECGVALGKLAREKLNDPYVAIDAYLAALEGAARGHRGARRALRALPRDEAGREGGRDAGEDARHAGAHRRPAEGQAGVVRARRDRPRRAEGPRQGGRRLQRRARSRLALHRGLLGARGACSAATRSGRRSTRTTSA